ncbi:MAG: exodeoxyribonuclease VII small subunit [Clostridia bacterium]|nr:exodeoxyribonuclease VII small subunit [Clostridia bacterium]
MAAKKKRTFEEQLSALETLIGEMENGGLSLEDSMKRYEEGVNMVAALEAELNAAEQRLTVLRQRADGTEEEVPLEEDAQ